MKLEELSWESTIEALITSQDLLNRPNSARFGERKVRFLWPNNILFEIIGLLQQEVELQPVDMFFFLLFVLLRNANQEVLLWGKAASSTELKKMSSVSVCLTFLVAQIIIFFALKHFGKKVERYLIIEFLTDPPFLFSKFNIFRCIVIKLMSLESRIYFDINSNVFWKKLNSFDRKLYCYKNMLCYMYVSFACNFNFTFS